jgi:tRNA nucleotidyltransferase/poly(A) polymerase
MNINWKEFDSKMVISGIKLMQMVNAYGYEALVVGGAVRDIVMGDKNIHDIDIATNMPINEIKSKFQTYDIGGEKHGTVIVIFENESFELTQFRVETGYSDNRHPDEVKFIDSFEEDSKRRDFTINSMGINADGLVIDYNGGIEDIKNGIIRCVGNANARFEEDALRIMRALRFAARFNFSIDDSTLVAIKNNAHNLENIAVERICAEMIKTTNDMSFNKLIFWIKSTGIFSIIFKKELSKDLEIYLDDLLEKVKNKSSIFQFIVFFNTTFTFSEDLILKSMNHLKMANEYIKPTIWCANNITKYIKTKEYSHYEIFKFISNEYFEYLDNMMHILPEIILDDEFILEHNKLIKAGERSSEISQLLLENRYFGKNFGIKLNEINTWLFDQYFIGKIPSIEEIKEKI